MLGTLNCATTEGIGLCNYVNITIFDCFSSVETDRFGLWWLLNIHEHLRKEYQIVQHGCSIYIELKELMSVVLTPHCIPKVSILALLSLIKSYLRYADAVM